MKKTFAVGLICALGLTQATLAATSLVGTWKLEKTACQSGAPYANFTGGFTGSLSATVTLTAAQEVKMSVQSNVKFDSSSSKEALKKIEASKAQLEQLPDSPSKQQALASIEESKAKITSLIQTYENGMSCTTDIAGTYSVNGSEMLTKTAIVKSNCDGATTEEEGKAQYQVSEDTLVITSQPEIDNGKSCPKGDSQVMTFSRVQ